MMTQEVNEVIDTFPKWLLLKKIAVLKIKKEITIGELAKELEIEQTHPYFHIILGFLIDKEVIKHTKTVGMAKFIKINYKKIENLIKETKMTQEFIDLIKKTNIIIW